MNVRFLSSGEKRKLLADLKDKFGIEKADYLFIETGKDRIRAFSGSLSRDEIVALGEFARVEIIGMYAARAESFGLRLGFDMIHLLKGELGKNVLLLSEEEFRHWMRGETIAKDIEKGVYVVKYENDFLGCGYSNGSKLLNYVPKERYFRG